MRFTPPKSIAETQFYGVCRELENEKDPKAALMLQGAALILAKYMTLCGWSSKEDDDIHYKRIEQAVKCQKEGME